MQEASSVDRREVSSGGCNKERAVEKRVKGERDFRL